MNVWYGTKLYSLTCSPTIVEFNIYFICVLLPTTYQHLHVCIWWCACVRVTVGLCVYVCVCRCECVCLHVPLRISTYTDTDTHTCHTQPHTTHHTPPTQ